MPLLPPAGASSVACSAPRTVLPCAPQSAEPPQVIAPQVKGVHLHDVAREGRARPDSFIDRITCASACRRFKVKTNKKGRYFHGSIPGGYYRAVCT